MRSWMPWTFLIMLAALPWTAMGAAPAAPGGTSHVNVITLDNQIISPVTSQYIQEAIERSERDGAACLVIEMDTPGGLLESTREIVKRIMNATVPVVVYVAPPGSRAGSAGVFITLAAHVAAMAPSTNIGAAHPVDILGGDGGAKKLLRPGEENKGEGGEGTPADTMTEKIVNDTVAWIMGIAGARGRNAEWARKAVTQSVSVTAEDALKEHIVDLLAADLPDLLAKIDGRRIVLPTGTVTLATRSAAVERIPMRWTQRLLAAVVHPNIAYILMMLGVLGLIIEFTHPTYGFSGIAGVICLVLALYSMQVLPVNYAAFGLIILGLALLIAEIKVVSHGLLALGGVAALTIGSLLLYESPIPEMRVSPLVVLPTVATLAAIVLTLVWRALSSQAIPVATGNQGMVGLVGEAVTDLFREGQVFVHGELWGATATEPVEQGEPVRVIAVRGLHLTVEPKEKGEEGRVKSEE